MMAKLSAHGTELGRIEFSTYAKAYFSDGKVLKNQGFGWKIYSKVKAGLNPADVFANAKARREAFIASHPAYAAYVKELHSMAGLCKRWKLRSALELLGDDVDGIWSECCDGFGDNISASVEEVAHLQRLYTYALAEQKEKRETENAIA
jgi:hypothetical protein